MQEVTWAACVASVVALAGTAINLWFARTSRRDQMQFDGEMVGLKAAVKDCEDDRLELRREVEDCNEKHAQADSARQSLEIRVAMLEQTRQRESE